MWLSQKKCLLPSAFVCWDALRYQALNSAMPSTFCLRGKPPRINLISSTRHDNTCHCRLKNHILTLKFRYTLNIDFYELIVSNYYHYLSDYTLETCLFQHSYQAVALRGIMVSELGQQIFISDFDSHWMLHISEHVPN